MEYGILISETSGVPSELGFDPDDVIWQDLALCSKTMELNDFYDSYESSASVARTVDEACLSCPVLAQCLQSGTENGEWGVWGGVYLTSGKPDHNKNSHKTPEVWKAIKERISGDTLL